MAIKIISILPAFITEIIDRITIWKVEKKQYNKYQFPHKDRVPEGEYFSKIVHMERTQTRWKKDAIAVYYDMVSFADMFDKVNNLTDSEDELEVLHIKQIYTYNSIALDDLLKSMSSASVFNYWSALDMNKCIGITEKIFLEYRDECGIGGIYSRRYWNESFFVDLYNNQYNEASDEEEDFCMEYDN